MLEFDEYCGFKVSSKKDTILPMSDTLKYMENSYENMVFKCSSNNWSIDIDRQLNITLLDIINYHLFINDLQNDVNISRNNHTIKVSKNIKLISLLKWLNALLLLFDIFYMYRTLKLFILYLYLC